MLARICQNWAFRLGACLVAAEQGRRYSAHEEYPRLLIHGNSLSRCLTEKLYCKLKDRVSKSGFTIDQAIQPGIDSPGNTGRRELGVIAGDEDCYEAFQELYNVVLEDYYHYPSHATHPDTQWSPGKTLRLPNEVQSVRVRLCRNVSSYPFCSHITRAGRRRLEKLLVEALRDTVTDAKRLQGHYRSVADVLAESSKDLGDKLETIGLSLHKSLRPEWSSCLVSRDWPDGRGIFVNDTDTLLAVTFNDREHVRVVLLVTMDTQRQNSGIGPDLDRFFDFVRKFEENIKKRNDNFGFAWDNHYGFLGTTLVNTGTAMKFSVRLKIPDLVQDSRFPSIVHSLPIQLDSSAEADGIVTVSNKDRIGKDEATIIEDVISAITKLAKIDRKLSKKETITEEFDF